MHDVSDTVVLGTGFAGLTAAARLAEEGHRVHCHGDGADGASLKNFGQLHSGAVYAPVLPEVAASCWQHRSRWSGLIGTDIRRAPGLALFASHGEVEQYVQAWSGLGIPARRLFTSELDKYGTRPAVAPAAAFALRDISVDVAALHARTIEYASSCGVGFAPPKSYAPFFSGEDVVLREPEGGCRRSVTLVLAVGHRTGDVLDRLGIQHPLAISHVPYGVLKWRKTLPLTYWLDGDKLAVSPQPTGIHVALPGRVKDTTDDAIEHDRLAAAMATWWPDFPVEGLRLRWGRVAEPLGVRPDPSAVVVDLSDPPPGWGRAANLVVCLPGKWTTAWHAADQVAHVIAGRG